MVEQKSPKVQIGIFVPFHSVPAEELIEDGSLPAALNKWAVSVRRAKRRRKAAIRAQVEDFVVPTSARQQCLRKEIQ